jgi:hypothetical protein
VIVENIEFVPDEAIVVGPADESPPAPPDPTVIGYDVVPQTFTSTHL